MAQISSRTARARAAMELKIGVLAALSKLGDRDTQSMAAEELQKIAETLPQESLPTFVSCIVEVGTEHKAAVRKECVRIVAALAASHGDALVPYLSKLLAFLMRRLKDPDSQIRDACVDTMGVLVTRVVVATSADNHQQQQQQQQQQAGAGSAGSASGGGALAPYTKPLFEAMGEQTKNVQVGAAMCLAKVFENASASSLSPSCVHRFVPRIVKNLSNPGFMARAALLASVASLSRAVKGSNDEHLSQLVPCVQESLQSIDWTARKAAAETLTALACPGLSKMKPSTMAALDACRFDKVKPVRDAVTCALQVWKTVPGPEADGLLKFNPKAILSPQEETPSFSRCWKEVETEISSPKSEAANDGTEKEESVASDDKSKSSRRKAPVVSDLKMNPDFFKKIESKNHDEWEVEVAVPRNSPSQAEDPKLNEKNLPSEQETTGSKNELPVECNGLPVEEHVSSFSIKATIEETASWVEATVQEQREQEQMEHKAESWDDVSTNGLKVSDQSVTGANWLLIQRQICQLQRGQTELLETLQVFMSSCQENILALQDRVQRLETSVLHLSQTASTRFGRHSTGSEMPARNKLYTEPAVPRISSKFSDVVEDGGHSDTSGSPYWTDPLSSSLFRNTTSSFRSLQQSSSSPPFRQLEDDTEEQPPTARRAWDRGSRHGEGPSARSVWRASKDEATLEAIRGAAGDELVGTLDCEKVADILEVEKEAENTTERAPSWLLWSRAMDSLHSGDVDSAYEEALSADDDLLLVRMMNQTGPVFEHFSSSTAVSMLRALVEILHQQHFSDSTFPWLQQVSDLVRTKGPECLKLKMDDKREIVLSLHDTSAMAFPERWMGNTLAKLALQLATAWSIDL